MLPLLNNRYRVLQELADGGFGRAFLAEDTHVPSMKKCVIKQLKPIADDPQVHQLVKDRFQREAALLEALGEGHNQIPKLYAYFSDADQFYLVEEWVQGQTLTQKVRQQGFLSEETVQALLVDLLQILEYIETRGIIHRDIKPDNIIVREADQKPVLIDFGAVKETLGTVVTQSGNSTRSIIVGTPGFMPSEQSIGRPVFSSDLYSLGLTAIFLLTAKFPQELGNDPRTGEILWRQFAPTISPAFAAVLDKAIQSHARDRYINAKAMLEAMRAIASPVLPPTVPILPSNPPSPPVYPSNPPNSPVYPSNPPNSPVYPSNPPNPPNPPVYPSHPPSPYAPAASPTPYYAPTPGQSPPTRMDVPASPAQGYYQGSGYPQAFAGPSNTGLMGGGGTFNTNAPVPPEIRGWNWGAFLLPGFWPFSNQVWIGLLSWIPYAGLPMSFILGAQGNVWAWRSRQWRSVEAFKAHQRAWTQAGLIVYGCILGLTVVVLGLASLAPEDQSGSDSSSQLPAVESPQELPGSSPVADSSPVSTNAELDGVWKLEFSAGSELHQALLYMQGSEGVMVVQYFNQAINKTQKVQQSMQLSSTAQGLLVVGSNPVDVDTEQPVSTYAPDRLLFQTQTDGTQKVQNCDAVNNCSDVTVEYLGKDLEDVQQEG